MNNLLPGFVYDTLVSSKEPDGKADHIMTTAAIIAEYNPFHEGHKYQIEETRKITGADYILVLMSGDFVQRGAPAIFNKYRRTKEALLGGADAVIELPSVYAVSSAEFFAGGSVTLLDCLDIVDYLSFGSESGEIDKIQCCASLLMNDSPVYQEALSAFLKQGFSYPAARCKAVLESVCSPVSDQISNDILSFSEEEICSLFSSPNNILAIEYCKALLALNSSIRPVTVKRQGAGYHEISLSDDPLFFNSASAIRKAMEQGNTAADYLTSNDFTALLHYKLLSERENGFMRYLDCTDDLSDKIIKNLSTYTDFTGFCNLLKSKDITYTRISRVLTHILLNIREPEFFKLPFSERQFSVPYARLLGFRKDSVGLLSSIKKKSAIPLISKLADASELLNEEGLSLLKQDIWVSDLYEAVYSQKYQREPLNEYRQSPVIV